MSIDSVLAVIAGMLGGLAWQVFWTRVRLPKHKKLAAFQAVQEYKAEQATKRHADHFHGEIGKLMGMPVFRSPLVPPNDIILMNTERLSNFFLQDAMPRAEVRIGSDVQFPPPDSLMDEITRQSEAFMQEWLRRNPPSIRQQPETDDVDAHRFLFTDYATRPIEFYRDTTDSDSVLPQEEVKPDVPEVHRPDTSTGDSGGSDTL